MPPTKFDARTSGDRDFKAPPGAIDQVRDTMRSQLYKPELCADNPNAVFWLGVELSGNFGDRPGRFRRVNRDFLLPGRLERIRLTTTPIFAAMVDRCPAPMPAPDDTWCRAGEWISVNMVCLPKA